MIRTLLILISLFALKSSAQLKEHDPKIAFAIETYAYVKGQNAALDKISQQFPHLEPRVSEAEKNIKHSFGRAENNILSYLQNELTRREIDLIHKQIDSLLNENLKKPIEKEQHARDFLLALKDRYHLSIKGQGIGQAILSFKYHDSPHEEIIDGHYNFFTTENHPKADTISLKIPVPASWLAQESSTPETIKQFTSCDGRGTEKILLLVYHLPIELQEITLNEKSILQILPPQTDLLRCEQTTIDDSPALMIEVEEKIAAGNEYSKVRMLQFMAVRDRRLFCIQGSIGPASQKDNLAPQLKKFEPLFRLIASRTEFD